MAAELHDFQMEHGRITGAPPAGRDAREPVAYWEVPRAPSAMRERLVGELAADPLLDGRWRAGLASESERERLGANARDWRSGCDCGGRQPCRHAQSLLFRFRQAAKRDPWLWWEAAGASREALQAAVREARAALVGAGSRAVADDEDAALEARARALAAAAGEGRTPWMLRRMSDPAFWNRDVTFADWLRPIADAVEAKEEQDDESDRAVDSHVSERP
ncbi:hypothetical protein [Paenibacillus sp.]|uniref:hypothetical protein n=1 Tax=Paenibacillus sp. TaxID=58172 RepID=UPI002D27150F|nr:hypothetical protein [Paenibacillus sp.]HZG55470.1 hypothetical protein [Paenibacillus sp.]